MEKLEWYKVFPKESSELPDKSGVYVISVLLKNGSFGVIYVGQSKSLKNRISQHFSESEANTRLKKYLKNNYTFKVSYATVDEDKLDEIEKFLIKKYSPSFNDEDGNGERMIECSLPNVVKFDI